MKIVYIYILYIINIVRELIIDEKSLDEILHNRFIYNLNKN